MLSPRCVALCELLLVRACPYAPDWTSPSTRRIDILIPVAFIKADVLDCYPLKPNMNGSSTIAWRCAEYVDVLQILVLQRKIIDLHPLAQAPVLPLAVGVCTAPSDHSPPGQPTYR